MSDSKKFLAKEPVIHPSAFIAPNATVVGDVVCGEDSSIWYQTVVRADVGQVRIGDRVNIQDLSMIHMSDGLSHTTIEDDVTVGHRAIIHGAHIQERALIGMGAVVLDNAIIGHDSIIGAHALVTKNIEIPPRSLVLGSPARVIRELTEAEVNSLPQSAAHYVSLGRAHQSHLNARDHE